MTLKKKQMQCLLLSLVLVCSCFSTFVPKSYVKASSIKAPMYGITCNQITTSNLNQVLLSIQKMSVKPTVRVVLDPSKKALYYRPILKKLHIYAFVMICPCDSSYFSQYPTVKAYQSRYKECVKAFARYVDIWEVGNEVNGEGWLGGTKQSIADRVYSAYNYLHRKGYKTELTPYMFAQGDQFMTMEAWLNRYIPLDMKKGINYVLVSYYDCDNQGKHENWSKMFRNLYKMFPNASLGFGECGYATPHKANSDFDKQMDRYYKMKKYNKRYVGGYFWWYYQEDCVPYSGNTRWKRLNQDIVWMFYHLK